MKFHNKIYFVHIAKTGGVSVEHLLSQIPDLNPCPAYYSREIFALDNLTAYGLYQGHLDYFCKPFIGEAFTFTILREPVERALSGLAHIERDPGHAAHQAFKESPDILSALDNPMMSVHLSNSMTRFLGLRPQFDKFNTQQAAIAHAQRSYREDDLLRDAKAALSDMDFIGFTESLDADQEKLLTLLNPTWAGQVRPSAKNRNPRKGTSTYQEALSDMEVEAMRRANSLDYELYRFAQRLARDRGWR